MAELIFIANYFDRIKPSPLALEVFSFDKQTQSYPSQHEILDRINPSLVPKSNYANKKMGLHIVATCGCVESTRYFLNKGSDLNKANNDGWTALILAAQNGHLEAVRLLLANNADFSMVNKDGNTAIIIAENNNHFEIVEEIEKAIMVTNDHVWQIKFSYPKQQQQR